MWHTLSPAFITKDVHSELDMIYWLKTLASRLFMILRPTGCDGFAPDRVKPVWEGWGHQICFWYSMFKVFVKFSLDQQMVYKNNKWND